MDSDFSLAEKARLRASPTQIRDLIIVEDDGYRFPERIASLTSYARPAKLFTARHILISSEIGVLKDDSLKRITDAIIHLLQPKAS